MPPCLLSKHCWFKPVYANSPTIVSTQRAFIVTVTGHLPEVLTAPVAYHAIVLRRSFRGPRGARELIRLNTGSGTDLTERELIRPSRGSGDDPTGQELGS
ncbi:hypothetical protein GW17_00057462 [Ensete ventricosum]|nr:hypothetical protein GW17_00057462 [Ensete ventricosum]